MTIDFRSIQPVAGIIFHLVNLDEHKSEKQHNRIVLDIFIKNLAAKKHSLDSFNNKIWMASIDWVLVSKTGQLTIRLKDGTEIRR